MRAEILLLPFTIEFRRRPLRPLRFSLRWLLLMVAVSGTFFFLVGEAFRLSRATIYHMTRAADDPTPMSRWHSAMAQKYRDAWERLDLLLLVLLLALAIVIVLGVLGRVVARIQPKEDRNQPNESSVRMR